MNEVWLNERENDGLLLGLPSEERALVLEAEDGEEREEEKTNCSCAREGGIWRRRGGDES